MNVFSIIFSILFIGLMCLFMYKSIASIVKTIKERKNNNKKSIEIKNVDDKKEK